MASRVAQRLYEVADVTIGCAAEGREHRAEDAAAAAAEARQRAAEQRAAAAHATQREEAAAAAERRAADAEHTSRCQQQVKGSTVGQHDTPEFCGCILHR